ncbi:MAG: sigma-70 family RNA polymerase sigma factor [Ruminiclostridium sp.]|nr:sigma-70 family RNA polymerase sigma factor [Ruminiclostridium sp.]
MEREFDEIYRLYANDLYKFILRLCKNETLAMDIMQDTMLNAITSIDKFNGTCSIKTYLCTIAKNNYFNYLKRADNHNIPLEEAEQFADGTSVEDSFESREQILQIHKALHRLDEPYREIFSLRVFAELKFSDIGAVFGQSENWARVSFYRAKKKLMELLKEGEDHE